MPRPASPCVDHPGRLRSTSDTSAAIPSAVSPTGSPVAYTTSFTYDALNRPTATSWNPVTTAAAPGAASSVLFLHTYNKANQRAGQSVSDNSWIDYPAAVASTVSYTANSLNQYTTVGAVTPTYDTNGNLTSDGTFTLGYDAENRLVSASGADNTAAYTFDAQGRRKTRTVNGATWSYFFAGYRSEEDDPTGTRHVLHYNPRGKAQFDIQDQTGLNLATKFLYDGLDGTSSTTLPESGSTTCIRPPRSVRGPTAWPPSCARPGPARLLRRCPYGNSIAILPRSALRHRVPPGRARAFTSARPMK